jgi:hypothetical protein
MLRRSVCFKRSFCSVWLFVEGYIYYTRGRRTNEQTTNDNWVGSLSQIQIPKFSSMYLCGTINNFQCIPSVQCPLSSVISFRLSPTNRINAIVLQGKETM